MEGQQDYLGWQTEWAILKYQDNNAVKRGEYEFCPFDGNLALNEGITEVMDLITGAAATAYSAANTYLGVGADSTAAVATQTGLQAPSNKVYVLVDSVAKSGQTITWQATFGSGVANFAWEEFTIANGSSDSADNLNRKVSAQGTKASPNIWILQCKITLG